MIARIWRGRVHAHDLAAYRKYVQRTGLCDYRATPGNRGAYLLFSVESDVAHVMTYSLWEDRKSIQAFAGDDIARTRYYPEDERYLMELPAYLEHFEIVEAVP